MKIFFTCKLVLISLVSLIIFQTISYAKAPSSVDSVNPKKFSGLWYEIARTYNSFEEDCVAATVEYKLKKGSSYKVTNRCFKKQIGAELIVYKGSVKPLLKDNMAKLEKTYFWVFSRNYKIIYLDDYKTAVMTDDDMENLWIMNREPFLAQSKLEEIKAFLSKYMDISRLIYTPQDEKGRYK